MDSVHRALRSVQVRSDDWRRALSLTSWAHAREQLDGLFFHPVVGIDVEYPVPGQRYEPVDFGRVASTVGGSDGVSVEHLVAGVDAQGDRQRLPHRPVVAVSNEDGVEVRGVDDLVDHLVDQRLGLL